jgi:hypothetical protein
MPVFREDRMPSMKPTNINVLRNPKQYFNHCAM